MTEREKRMNDREGKKNDREKDEITREKEGQRERLNAKGSPWQDLKRIADAVGSGKKSIKIIDD